jgi:uncharacterized protein YukE
VSESSELQRAVESLTRSIDQLRSELVRKDVYESDQRGLNQRLTGIEAGLVTMSNAFEKVEERRAADRRLLLSSFALPLLLILIQLYLAARVGGSA